MPLDDADKTFIKDLLGEATKGFLTAEDATKLVNQNLEETFQKTGLNTLGDTLKGLNAKIESLEKGSGDSDDGKDKKGGKGGEADDLDPRLAKLKEQQAELERKMKEANDAREQAEAREKANKLQAGLRDALIKGGVDASKVHLVMPTLLGQKTDKGEPVVALDDNGNVVWRQQKAGYVDTISVADGVGAWTQTDDGKTFLPPKAVEGTDRDAGSSNVPKTEAGKTDFSQLAGRLNLSNAL